MSAPFKLVDVEKKPQKRVHVTKRSKIKENYQIVYDFKSDINKFLTDYNYQNELTNHLDNLEENNFDQSLINEIVLWKLNRYVSSNKQILTEIDTLITLRKGQHRKSKEILENLIEIRGVDLAMASTILRFRNPEVFQIIDRHAYRAVYGVKYPLYPTSSKHQKIELYFEYLDKLLDLSQKKGLEFRTLDRLLYEFDKQLNGKL
jgi:thermostable 8-oxoguanine DNA glycosylase